MDDPAKNPYVASTATSGTHFSSFATTIKASSRVGLIITFALFQGVILISAITGFLGMRGLQDGQAWFRFDGDSMLFILVGFGMFFAMAIAAVVARMVIKRSAIHDYQSANEELPRPLEEDTELPPAACKLLGASAMYTLIGQALLEGSGVINAIFILLENNLVFVFPILIAVVGIAIQAPFPSRLKSLLENAADR